MITINRTLFQKFPFHLVSVSPWPILVSFSLFSMLLGAVLYMHGFQYGGNLLTLGLILTASGMGLWFRDITTEGTGNKKLDLNLFCNTRTASIVK